MKDLLDRVWRTIKGWSLQELDTGLYVIRFEKKQHLDLVMRYRTWMLSGPSGALLALFNWPPSGKWDKVDTSSVPIWVQVHDLPLMFMTQANATKLAAKVGSLMDIHNKGQEGIMGWKFLRFKVLVNLNKPLFAGCFVSCSDGGKVWAQFRYERIAALCYKCGTLGHDHHWCVSDPVLVKGNEGLQVWKFGSWIRAEARIRDCFGSVSSLPCEETSQAIHTAEDGGSSLKPSSPQGNPLAAKVPISGQHGGKHDKPTPPPYICGDPGS
ncbi:hypothetical protein UlMin_000848 [Ulmus minor]